MKQSNPISNLLQMSDCRSVGPRIRVLLSLLFVLAAGTAVPSITRAQVQNETNTSRAIERAIDEYKQTGVARIIEDGQTIIVPYGQVHPILKTALLRTTLIELDHNEYVIDRFIGDSLRWNIDYGVAGQQGNFHQIVSVKPKDQDVTTSLVLTTSFGRIYQFTLDSEPYDIEHSTNPVDIPYTKHVKFYYPDGAVMRVPPPEEALPGLLSGSNYTASGSQAITPGARRELIDIASLNTNYEVRADPLFPCTPRFVGDDGVRLFVQFPDGEDDPLCATRYPLFAVDENDELHLLNYEVFGGNTYVAERIPVESVILYVTDKKDQREVRIINKTLQRRIREREGPLGRLKRQMYFGGGGGATFPMAIGVFRDTYNVGYNVRGLLGMNLSAALSAYAFTDYVAFSLNESDVRDAVQFAVNPTLARELERQLIRELPEEETLDGEVVVFARADGGSVTDVAFGVGLRYLLARRRKARPYVGMRMGLSRRSARPLRLRLSAQLQPDDQERDLNDRLNQLLRAYAGDPLQGDFLELLADPLDPEYDLPGWLLAEQVVQTLLDMGFSFGVLQQVGPRANFFLEVTYDFSFTSREYRAFAPLSAGLLVDL